MATTKELSFKISSENLLKIVNVLKDLSSIDDKSLFKFDKKHVLIYTLVGEGKGINAFKSFIFDTNDIFEIDDFNETIDFIAKDIKSIYRNLLIMLDLKTSISGKIYYDEIGDKFFSDRIFFKSDSKLKLNFYGSDPMAFNTSISVNDIKKLTDIEKSNFSFDMSNQDYTNIKRLSTTSKDVEVFYMNTFEKDEKYYISIGESSWDLTIAEIDYDEVKTISFPKKYFKSITMTSDTSKIFVFDRFLLIKTEGSDLLISIEITV